MNIKLIHFSSIKRAAGNFTKNFRINYQRTGEKRLISCKYLPE